MGLRNKKAISKLFAYTLLVGVFACLALLQPKTARAATGVNQQLNFQGRLLNAQGATVPDGYYNIQFKIYQDGDGQTVGNTTGSPAGSLKWTESHLNANGKGVMVKNGFMSVQLGSITAFGSSINWNQDTLWLSMNVGNTNVTCTPFTSCAPDGEMVPMKRLSSTPYALNAGMLNGLTSASFLQIAQGLQTDVSTNTASIAINKTGSGNFLQFQANGTDAFTLNNSGDILFGSNSAHTISVATATSGTGKALTISAGNANSASAGAGGTLTLQGGNAAGIGNFNGGDIAIAGGTGTGTGVKGLVNLSASAFQSVTSTACAANCTINQSYVNNYGTVIISSSTSGIVITLPAPTNSVAGRILYVTTDTASTDFILRANSGADQVDIAMRNNTTSTMIWNGTAWTPGGASNATTLQATYNNGTNPATTPEIKLDTIRGTIDIQDADISIGEDILNIRASQAGNLGTVLFGVSNTGRVTIQGTTDQDSSFRVLNSSGEYLFNINSFNNYTFSNGIRTAGNEITNPSFEAGGDSIGGEEGWFGTSQSSIVNSNANNGNHALQVIPNGTNLDIYAGSYYEVRPGDNLYLEGYVKNAAGSNGAAGVQITWYNKDRTVLSYSTAYPTLPGTSYVLRKVSGTAPAGAVYARVSATVRNISNTGTFYFDDFYFKRSSEAADYTFRNTENSTTAFRIQSAQSTDTLFTADTTNNILKVGNSTGSDTNTTLLVLDSAATDPTTSLASKNGGLFYRSDTNSLKAVLGGTVVDICTTAITCAGYSASAGSSIQLQSSTPGTAQIGHFNITGTGILTQLQTQDQFVASTNSNALTIRSGNASGLTSNSGNLILDVGTATGTRGSITIGTGNVTTTMGGTLAIQGSNTLSLGTSSSATGSILFRTSAGANTVTLRAPGANPTASYTLTLPQNIGIAGDCLKDTGGGSLGFGNCASGFSVNLQGAYDNSPNPATLTLADGKDLKFIAQDTTTDANIIFDLQCTTTCNSTANGRFMIQNGGASVFSVLPNGQGIVLSAKTQIGSSTPDSTQVNFQLDSYNQETDSGTCDLATNQGAMYYNTAMGSIRACINGDWGDVSNPDTLGLLTFGIVPSSGSNPYDLPSLIVPGVSGPCKVSWASSNTVTVQSCAAYSAGRRFNVPSATLSTSASGMTLTNRWTHVCINSTDGSPYLTAASSSASANMPNSTTDNQLARYPVLCIASIQGVGSGTAGTIDNLYDTRTFTSVIKEAIISSSAVELGMIVDAGTNGAVTPAASGSAKLYGVVVATTGGTSTGIPNVIVATVGPGWVKATAGTAGQFIKTSLTAGYGDTTASIPNNSFYYSVGNTRTNYNTTCTSASNCSGSLYVNFIVR